MNTEPRTFKASTGHIFVVGRNMYSGVEGPHLISWSDPKTGAWSPEIENQAGCMLVQYDLPQDVKIREEKGSIIFDERIKFEPDGWPFIWKVSVLPE